jgi:lysophospholipase L1-like esterase
VAPGKKLRILPIGDSITYGARSTQLNGYRLALQERLSGSKSLFIGSVRAGSMKNNQNEGHSGETIIQIASHDLSLSQRPNIVLLHAGTNDMHRDPPALPWSSAPNRLGDLIDKIVARCPDAVVLVAKIIPALSTATDNRINSKVPGVVASRAAAGKKVMVVDFSTLPKSGLFDYLHPSDSGYAMMADYWLAGLQIAEAKGWITDAIGDDPGVVGGDICNSIPAWARTLGIASGAGIAGNGQFTDNWVRSGSIATGVSGWNASDIRLVDLDGDG